MVDLDLQAIGCRLTVPPRVGRDLWNHLDVVKKEVDAVMMAVKKYKLQEFTADLQSKSGSKNCFSIARHVAREGRAHQYEM